MEALLGSSFGWLTTRVARRAWTSDPPGQHLETQLVCGLQLAAPPGRLED